MFLKKALLRLYLEAQTCNTHLCRDKPSGDFKWNDSFYGESLILQKQQVHTQDD